MSGNDVVIASTKGDSGLVQARFGPGMLLHHQDLERLGAFPRELSALLFRSFFGCGVVCGLVVDEPVLKCGKLWITVQPGLALACSGHPISVPTAQTVTIDESCEAGELRGPFYLVLCPTAKCCAPRAASCGGDEEEPSSVCTQERYGFEIRVLRNWPECGCGCGPSVEAAYRSNSAAAGGPLADSAESAECRCVDCGPCHADHYAGKCGCACDGCSDCDCDCVVLACLHEPGGKETAWQVDHRCRRFIRPVRMRDPEVAKDAARAAYRAAKKQEADAAALLELQGKHAARAARREATKQRVAESVRRADRKKLEAARVIEKKQAPRSKPARPPK